METIPTVIVIGALFVFLVVLIPILDYSRFSKCISLRYTLVSLFVVLSVGCIIDFAHVSDELKKIILIGTFILVSGFVLLRSFEKLRFGSKQVSFEVKKGDASAKMRVVNDKENSDILSDRPPEE